MILRFFIQPPRVLRPRIRPARRAAYLAALLIAGVLPAVMQAQAAPKPQNTAPTATTGQEVPESQTAAKRPSSGERRKAVKLYLEASKLYADSKFEQALADYQQAAKFDPTNADYSMAANVARSHAVEALVQAAAKARLTNDAAGARAALARALALDPANPVVTQHLYELGDDAVRGQPQPRYQPAAAEAGSPDTLQPTAARRSFHLHMSQKQVIQQVFKAYGIDPMFDSSVTDTSVRLDLDEVDFAAAAHIVGLVTGTFYVPIDAHRVLVAKDTRENRQQFMRQELETIRLPGLSDTEINDVSSLAKNVFSIQTAAANVSAGTLTLRAAPATLDAFNGSIRSLLEGRDQVMLDVRIIQVSHAGEHNTGITPPQTFSAFNVYSMEQSILSQNQDLVQEIISSGLAPANDPLAILGILLASGQVSSSLLTNGIALFGGGLTASGLSPGGPATLTMSLNSSDSRQIDRIQLRLGDGEASTIKEGTKYPIQTASYSSLPGNLSGLAGIGGAGSSSSLSSLLAQYGSATPTIPMIEYQDLGLTLKVTPKVMRGGEIALTIDLKIDALSGSSVNGNPILNSQAFSAVATLKEGEAAEVASHLTKQQSRAVSGTPGLGQIPGLNSAVSDKDVQTNYSTLVIVITPHLVRGTQPAGRSQQILLEKGSTTAQ